MNALEERPEDLAPSTVTTSHAVTVGVNRRTAPTEESRPESAMRSMMIAGGLGLVAVALVVAAPEIGVGGVIGGAVAGSGSAIATLFARR